MKIADLREKLAAEGILLNAGEKTPENAEISLVSYDSREVIPGALFVCKGAGFGKGFSVAGHDAAHSEKQVAAWAKSQV